MEGPKPVPPQMSPVIITIGLYQWACTDPVFPDASEILARKGKPASEGCRG